MEEFISNNKINFIDNLAFYANQVVEGFITGLHKSPYHGFSVEFAEHRLYNSGESTKHIDWKLFARTEKLFIKRYEEETNLRCQIVLDVSSSMYFPIQKKINLETPNKIGFSILAAASLMNLFRRQRDAVGLSIYADTISTHTKPLTSSSHHKMLLLELYSIVKSLNKKLNTGTSTVNSLHEISDRIHQRSLIVIFSDLINHSSDSEELFSALQHLKYNKHEVIIFHVIDRDRELNFNFDSRMHRFVDLESGEELRVNPSDIKNAYEKEMSNFETFLREKCGQFKIDFVPVDCHKGIEPVLMSYLQKRKKLY